MEDFVKIHLRKLCVLSISIASATRVVYDLTRDTGGGSPGVLQVVPGSRRFTNAISVVYISALIEWGRQHLTRDYFSRLGVFHYCQQFISCRIVLLRNTFWVSLLYNSVLSLQDSISFPFFFGCVFFSIHFGVWLDFCFLFTLVFGLSLLCSFVPGTSAFICFECDWFGFLRRFVSIICDLWRQHLYLVSLKDEEAGAWVQSCHNPLVCRYYNDPRTSNPAHPVSGHLLWNCFENRKNYPKLCFIPGTCFHVFFTRLTFHVFFFFIRFTFHVFSTRGRTELDSLFSRVLAILWWEVSRPVLFSRGIVRIFYGVGTFGEKIKKRFHVYIDVSSEKGVYFMSKSRPKMILRKVECVYI